MTIDTPENKTATQKFNEFFQKTAEKYGIKNFEELKSKELTKEDMKNLINEYNITGEDKYNLMDLFHEMNEEKLRHTAIVGAKAAIIMRNLSHNIGEIALKDNDFDEFADFCGIDKSEVKGKNKFQKLFLKDSEKMENHPLNIIYTNLRKEGKSPYEAIINLPREEESEARGKGYLVTSKDEVMEGSKMGSTMYCTGRINTILGILALNEGIDYVNKHFKYAEILKDGLTDIIKKEKHEEREESYLNEALNYEDPHQMLIFTDDEGNEFEIDTNQIIIYKKYYWIPKFDNVIKKYDGNVGEVAYEMYFLDYINNELKNPNGNIDKENAIKRLEAYNELVGGSEVIIKRLIAYAIDLGNEQLEKKYTKKLQDLGEKYPCIKDKLSYHIAMDSLDELEDFIHKEYGPQFTIDDVISQFN